MMVCGKCGAILQEEAKFCAKCGSVQITRAMRVPQKEKPPIKHKKAGNPKEISIPLIVSIIAVCLFAAGLLLWSPWSDDGAVRLEEESVPGKWDKQEEAGFNQAGQSAELRLSRNDLTLIVGQTEQLRVTGGRTDAEAQIAWCAEDAGTVHVQDGLVTALHAGQTIVTADTGDIRMQCHVTVMERAVEAIRIVQEPAKKIYFVGDTAVDTTGLVLETTYNDGRTERISSGFGVDFNFSASGLSAVTVIFGGKTDGYMVEVRNVELASISVLRLPNDTQLVEGESLDITGLSVRLCYSDGSEQVISNGFEFSPKSFHTAGTQTVQVSYGGKTAGFPVYVEKKTVVSLYAECSSYRTYYIGDSFDASDLRITALYNDQTSASVSAADCQISYQFRCSGSNTVHISCAGKSTDVQVMVKTPGISIVKGSAGGKTMQLCAQTEPGVRNVVWTVDDSSVACVNSKGVVTAKEKGTVRVCAAFVYNGITYSDEMALTVNEQVTRTENGIWETSSPQTTGEELVLLRTEETVTGYVYAHYCGYVNGDWNVDSCWVNQGSHYHTMESETELPASWIDGDRGGRANEVKYGAGCVYGSTAWWLDHCICQYRYVYQRYCITRDLYFT